MSIPTVYTQAEFDQAVADGATMIDVRSEAGVWVTAYGSATVTAYGSATVTATPRVAVHLRTGRATIAGGVIIDHTASPVPLPLATPAPTTPGAGVAAHLPERTA